jgi:hypothetical protein
MDLFGSLIMPPAPAQATPLQIVGIVLVPGPPGSAVVFVSEDKMPAGVMLLTVGVSADADQALPHGPTTV